MSKSKDFYLLMLAKMLIAVRNLENTEIETARNLAYIFHNVPGVLRVNFDEDTSVEMLKNIKSRAKHLGCLEQVEQWETSIMERLEYEGRSVETSSSVNTVEGV